MPLQDGLLGRFEHAIQAADDGERQDDLAVLGLLVVAPEQISDGPDEGSVVADRLALGAGSAQDFGGHGRSVPTASELPSIGCRPLDSWPRSPGTARGGPPGWAAPEPCPAPWGGALYARDPVLPTEDGAPSTGPGAETSRDLLVLYGRPIEHDSPAKLTRRSRGAQAPRAWEARRAGRRGEEGASPSGMPSSAQAYRKAASCACCACCGVCSPLGAAVSIPSSFHSSRCSG